MSGEGGTSPFRILATMKCANCVFYTTIASILSYNLFMQISAAHFGEARTMWLAYSGNFSVICATYIHAIMRVSSEMRAYHYEYRVVAVSNEISFSIMIYICGISTMLISACVDILFNGGVIGRAIRREMATAGSSALRFKIVYVLISCVSIYEIFLGDIYCTPIALYRSDIDMMLSVVLFAAALSCPVCLAAFFMIERFPKSNAHNE